MRGTAAAAAFAVLLVLLATAAASSGDTNLSFRRCTMACESTGCTASQIPQQGLQQKQWCSPLCSDPAGQVAAVGGVAQGVPPALRFWRWDCASDCRYLCMWQRELAKHSMGIMPPVEKYYGKWPFTRLLGMQEPASVVFSLLNLAAQLRCLHCYARLVQLRRDKQHSAGGSSADDTAATTAATGSLAAAARDQQAARHCARLWPAYFLLSAAAWLASAVFHGRDTHATEHADYYTAGALVAFTTYLSAVRTLRISSLRPRAALAASILAYLLRHVYRMQYTLFDYGLHIRLCIIAGLAQAMLWLYWAMVVAPRAHHGRGWLLAFLILIHCSMLLEVLDFPPLAWALDAHAFWHLCTAPLAYVWYRFVVADWLYGSRGGGSRKHEH